MKTPGKVSEGGKKKKKRSVLCACHIRSNLGKFAPPFLIPSLPELNHGESDTWGLVGAEEEEMHREGSTEKPRPPCHRLADPEAGQAGRQEPTVSAWILDLTFL